MPRKRQRASDELWFVETILKARRTRFAALAGKDFLHSPAWEYYIKWAGFDDTDNTWEPISSLEECKRLIVSFWEHVGVDSFLINAPGFELEPSDQWIAKEKRDFASKTPTKEVEEQNRNPKRKRSNPSSPLTPSTSRLFGSPRKVSFAKVADERIILPLEQVENSAQWYSSSQRPTSDPSDSEDDIPIPEILNSTPTKRATSPHPEDIPQTPEPCGPEPLPEIPSETSSSLFSPPSTSHRGIKFYDVPVTPSSMLATKQRLATASVAPGIPRASPAPAPPAQQAAEVAPADDVMDVDSTPTIVPDQNAILDADGDEGPMLTSMFLAEDTASASGFYATDEDRYASLRNNDDPLHDVYDNVNWFEVEGADAVSSSEAVDFLNSIELSAPVDHGSDYRPSRPIYGPAPITQWAWHGQLSVSVDGQTETICEKSVITDSTECAPPRIASFVPSKQPLELAACYDIEDILVFLDVCKPAHQFARLIADGPDGERLKIFSEYLARKTKACMVPALWDGRLRGVLLFVSPASKRLLDYLRTPSKVQDTGLVVILLFVCDPPPIEQQYKKTNIPQLKCKMEPALMTPEQWCKSLQHERDYHVSLRIIQPSKAVREYVYRHASTVWPSCDSNNNGLDQDTIHLLRVLKKSRFGVVAPTDTSADVVFIHVGALKNVPDLPHLAQRRLRPEVRFCLYGTHETVPPSLWGFQEIYLLGGVVTFTPEALVNDAWSVLKTIRLIHAHPLWDCYLTPQVVGMAVKLIQLREDEMPEYIDALPFAFNNIINAIRKEEISLTTAPLNDLGDDDYRRWVLANSVLKPRTTEAILEHCTKAFDAAYASSPQARWSTLAKNDLIADVRRMQIQPSVRTDYRRFIVLDSNVDLRDQISDGVSRCPYRFPRRFRQCLRESFAHLLSFLCLIWLDVVFLGLS
ncbi:hypothetical protein B0H12DRAFT_1325632 [Mycena haematopus]|nr:hypothetical protein B0H12DRAFT_1325632 [Mycena haematopus]